MNFRFKHAVAVSALTLALLGGASGFSTFHHSAHASMGSPELYYSNGHHHNVYYAMSGGLEGDTLLKNNRLYYGPDAVSFTPARWLYPSVPWPSVR